MISRSAILSAAKAGLEASSALTAIQIVLETGTHSKTVEEQLKLTGSVIVLSPVLRYESVTQEAGAMVGNATFAVSVRINPTVNAEQSTPLELESVRQSVIAALIALAADDHGDRFRCTGDILEESDPGLLAAEITFQKGCQVNAL